MKKSIGIFLWGFVLVIAVSGMAAAETITCTQCGMVSDAGSKFTARMVQDGKDLFFCDIGDLLVYMSKKNVQSLQVQVRDYPTGNWIDAHRSFYVQSTRKFNSPMGWDIAAFRNKQEAAGRGAVMDFEAAMKAVQ